MTKAFAFLLSERAHAMSHVPEGVEATAKNGDVTVTEPYGPTPNGRRRKRR